MLKKLMGRNCLGDTDTGRQMFMRELCELLPMPCLAGRSGRSDCLRTRADIELIPTALFAHELERIDSLGRPAAEAGLLLGTKLRIPLLPAPSPPATLTSSLRFLSLGKGRAILNKHQSIPSSIRTNPS